MAGTKSSPPTRKMYARALKAYDLVVNHGVSRKAVAERMGVTAKTIDHYMWIVRHARAEDERR